MSLDPPTRAELIEAGVIDPYARVQSGLTREDVYPPRDDGLCACGCGQELEGRRKRWATDDCARWVRIRFSVIYGDTRTIRRELWRREEGICEGCKDPQERNGDWEAHHILPVEKGGGGCELDGFWLLCSTCHQVIHR